MAARKARKAHKVSAATRAKISKSLTGKKHPHKGHKLSAAARSKISAKLKGKPHPHKGHKLSAEARAKLSAKLKGKKMSAAARAKLAARMKGKKMSAAARAKLAARMKGRKLSAATRAKIAAKLKARHGNRPPKHPPKHPGQPRRSGAFRALKPKSLKAKGNAKLRRSSYRLLTSTMHGHNHNLFKHRTRRHAIVIRRSVRAHRMWRKRKRR